MITFQDFLETVDYEITGGDAYCWHCFGEYARILSSDGTITNGDDNDSSVSIVFDPRDQVVYQMEAFDFTTDTAYRWTNPDWQKEYDAEVKRRGIKDEAFDGVPYIDIDVASDMLEKAHAIHRGIEYDRRVQIPVEFDDETLLLLMMEAHKRDITFNQLVEQAVAEACKAHGVAIDQPVE
jgi:hypothetical protein